MEEPCGSILEKARKAKLKALALFKRWAPVVGASIPWVGEWYGLLVDLI
jgi:hypothetical protein